MSLGGLPKAQTEPRLVWVVVQLAALSFYKPLTVVVGPQRAVASVLSALVLGLLVTVVSYSVFFLCRPLAKSGWKALVWTSVTILFFWNWTALSLGEAIPPWLISGALFLLAIAGIGRFAGYRRFQMGAFVASVTISATLLGLLIRDEITTPAPVVSAAQSPAISEMTTKPDVLFILLDGYARSDVLSSLYDFDNSEFLGQLEAEGFTVPSSSNANYTGTHFSLPSMLEMSYLAEPGQFVSNSDLEALAQMISGDNLLVETLKSNGYTYIHGDTDHWLNTCGTQVDICLPGPLIDITGDALLANTPLGPLVYPTSGSPTTALNLDRLDELSNWNEFSQTLPEGPRFVFLHLVLPHPPLFLDSSCAPRVDPDLDGHNVSSQSIPVELLPKRRSAYVDQVGCANRTVLEFLEQVDRDAVIVITADHGPDSLNPLVESPETWTPEQVKERFAAFSAMRLPPNCDARLDENHQLVNTFRVVLGCLTSTSPVILEERFFAVSYGGLVLELKNPDQDAE